MLGTREWFVIHHTNCGMELFSDEVMADLLDDDLATASFDGKSWSNPHHHGGHAAGHFIKWHTIKDQESSVVQDVRCIREHPLVPSNVPIYGYIYDVRTGRLNEVKAATKPARQKRPDELGRQIPAVHAPLVLLRRFGRARGRLCGKSAPISWRRV